MVAVEYAVVVVVVVVVVVARSYLTLRTEIVAGAVEG